MLQTVIFDMFYRNNPCGGGFAICAGLEQMIEYIENLRFAEEDITYLRSLGIFEEDFLEYLSNFKFTGDIYAIPEGTVIFPREPMVKVIAPIMEAQLVETAILNIMNHQSLIATKAARVCHAAKGDPIMEFGLRRAQGPDAGIFGARAAVIGGCAGTSNVLTGQMFDVPVLGTHAHSWIMSFPDEYTAFKTYAKLYPNSCTLLVDTYDVLKSGVPNAIRVFEEMREEGIQLKNYGIRIDSGDLAYLSKKAYKMLAAAGFDDATISASSDLDEYLIESLKAQDAKINSWGVGTKLITADDNPAFGGVYKLAAVKDADSDTFQPKIKLSENTEKVTNPGNKTVYRIYSKKTGKIKADLICLADEKFDPEETMVIFDPVDTWKKTNLGYEATGSATATIAVNSITDNYGVSFSDSVTVTPGADCAGYYYAMIEKTAYDAAANLGETICKQNGVKYRAATEDTTFSTDYYFAESYLVLIPVDNNGKMSAPVTSELLTTSAK